MSQQPFPLQPGQPDQSGYTPGQPYPAGPPPYVAPPTPPAKKKRK